MSELRLAEDAVEWREVEGEVVALERKGSAYLGVNRSGTTLWHALKSGCGEEELAQRLVEHYGIELERARDDVASFLAQLRARGLIRAA